MRTAGVQALLVGSVVTLVIAVSVVSCTALTGVDDLSTCTGCEDDGGANADATDDATGIPPIESFTIGGTVSNLIGKGLIVQNNGAEDLPIASSGPFAFPNVAKSGDAYAVTVLAPPTDPSQLCAVERGSGTVAGTNVTDVSVVCSTIAFSVGGVVLGTIGAGAGLTNNGGDDLAIPATVSDAGAAGSAFTFATKVPSGSPFKVAIKGQPESGGPCDVSGATGVVGVANVTSVVLNCTPGTFTVGGTITGLTGTVIVQDNGGNDTTLTANGSFAIARAVAPGGAYAVTVLTQPKYPPKSQTCTVVNGTGAVTAANVTNVEITCVTNTYAVTGSVADLTTGTLVLKDNGADDLSLTASGPFAFATKVPSGSAYGVTIGKMPSAQLCTIASGSGTIANADVTNVRVQCNLDPGIKCGATAYCKVGTQFCCSTGAGAGTCLATGTACNGDRIACDSTADCGGAGGVCCAAYNKQGMLNDVRCQSSVSACQQSPGPNGSSEILCDPITKANPCPGTTLCSGTSATAGYKKCQ